MKPNTVCRPDCPKRSATCHAECETYLAAREKNLQRYEEKALKFQIDEMVDRSIKIRLRAIKKKKKAR